MNERGILPSQREWRKCPLELSLPCEKIFAGWTSDAPNSGVVSCPQLFCPALNFRSTSTAEATTASAALRISPTSQLLPDGRFVVAYQSDYFGSATDTDPIVAIFNANGSTSLAYRDAFNAGGHQKVPAVAERLNGGFGVVFQNDRHANGTVDSNGPNITYVPVSAAGGTPVADRRRRLQRRDRDMTPCRTRRSPRSRAGGRSSRSSASGRRMSITTSSSMW